MHPLKDAILCTCHFEAKPLAVSPACSTGWEVIVTHFLGSRSIRKAFNQENGESSIPGPPQSPQLEIAGWLITFPDEDEYTWMLGKRLTKEGWLMEEREGERRRKEKRWKREKEKKARRENISFTWTTAFIKHQLFKTQTFRQQFCFS